MPGSNRAPSAAWSKSRAHNFGRGTAKYPGRNMRFKMNHSTRQEPKSSAVTRASTTAVVPTHGPPAHAPYAIAGPVVFSAAPAIRPQ